LAIAPFSLYKVDREYMVLPVCKLYVLHTTGNIKVYEERKA